MQFTFTGLNRVPSVWIEADDKLRKPLPKRRLEVHVAEQVASSIVAAAHPRAAVKAAEIQTEHCPKFI